MERWQNKIAVVTGVSSGIGAAIVKDFINAGLIVIGLARRIERVETLRTELPVQKQKNFHGQKCDVSKLESVNEAFDWIIKKFGAIDILVNNAGCHRVGQLCQMDTQLVQEVLQTNVMGVVHCTQRAFASMKERNFDGHVIIMNSIVGHQVFAGFPGEVPAANIYSPSKFALTAINEIYRQEFKGLGTKIRVTSICPGVVDTEFISDEYKKLIPNMLKAEDISQGVMFALSTPPHVQIHELTIKPLGEYF